MDQSATAERDGERVLVLGATGTAGEPLVDALRARDVVVRVATRRPAAARDRIDDDTECVEFDFERPETWGATLEAVDRLFLLVPPSIGVARVRDFIDAAARVGVQQIAFLSILGADSLPVLPHRRIERHLERAALAWTTLRASWFMQNLSEIHRAEIVERDEIFVPAGDGPVSLTDARDVAAVAATVLCEPGHENRAYDVTGPDALTFADVATAFSDVLDRRITYADPSRLAFAKRMYQRGYDPGFIAFMVAEYSVIRLGVAGRTTRDVARVLGREPRTVREFVADSAETFRAER